MDRLDFGLGCLTLIEKGERLQVQRPTLAVEQRQKLSPRMLQSLRLMALPALELSEQINAELEANPALEVLEDRSELSIESVSEDAGENRDDDWFENASDSGRVTSAVPDDEDPNRMFLEGAITRPETLQEHLLGELGLQKVPPEITLVAERLIQNLDEDGFHKTAPEDLCADRHPDLLAGAITLVRSLDPVGTCVSDYRESLLVQAALDANAPSGAVELLRDHVELLEKGKLPELRKAMKIGEAEFKRLLDYLGGLNPFPGRTYSAEASRFVIPDLYIRIENGEFIITLNDEAFPVLGINPLFDELAAGSGSGRKAQDTCAREGAEARGKEAASFARENVERARFFIGSLHQRNLTLLKVTRAIIRFQRAFFFEGPRALVPLSLKDVADEVGLHETTVSRAVNGKYAQTDRGLIELRRFFTNSISGAGSHGSDHSKEGVKEVIREILAGEAGGTGGASGGTGALSDREIMEVLARRGIRIARRTVAKYRGELDLDSSFSRGKT